jgi:hypothetical protein
MGEKCRSTPQVTIHRRPENSKLCLRFVLNWLEKDPRDFGKVLEGSVVHNFGIETLDHFC